MGLRNVKWAMFNFSLFITKLMEIQNLVHWNQVVFISQLMEQDQMLQTLQTPRFLSVGFIVTNHYGGKLGKNQAQENTMKFLEGIFKDWLPSITLVSCTCLVLVTGLRIYTFFQRMIIYPLNSRLTQCTELLSLYRLEIRLSCDYHYSHPQYSERYILLINLVVALFCGTKDQVTSLFMRQMPSSFFYPFLIPLQYSYATKYHNQNESL